jgi:hypothetical protein
MGVTFGFLMTGGVLRSPEAVTSSTEVELDKRYLLIGLLRIDPQQRESIEKVFKNPFIRGDRECLVCFDKFQLHEGVPCPNNDVHFLCSSCFNEHVKSEAAKELGFTNH